MRDKWRSFIKDESGATAIEYGLLAGLISIVIVASVGSIKDELVVLFEAMHAALKDL